MRITCLMPDSLGDFILTTPCLRSLRKHFPKDEITCVLPEPVLEASRLFPLKACIQDDSPQKENQETQPDLTVCFPPATRYYRLARRIGGKKRIGYVHEKMFFARMTARRCLTDFWICPPEPPVHELDAYGKILSLIGVPFEPEIPEPELPISPLLSGPSSVRGTWSAPCRGPFQQTGADVDQKSIGPVPIFPVIHLGARWIANPLAPFRKLEPQRFRLAAVFAEHEAAFARRMIAEAGLPDLRVVEPGPLSGILPVLRQSSLFIGVDGGLVHLAAAARVPVLAFYPPERFDAHVARWRPWGVPYRAVPLSPENVSRIPALTETLGTAPAHA